MSNQGREASRDFTRRQFGRLDLGAIANVVGVSRWRSLISKRRAEPQELHVARQTWLDVEERPSTTDSPGPGVNLQIGAVSSWRLRGGISGHHHIPPLAAVAKIGCCPAGGASLPSNLHCQKNDLVPCHTRHEGYPEILQLLLYISFHFWFQPLDCVDSSTGPRPSLLHSLPLVFLLSRTVFCSGCVPASASPPLRCSLEAAAATRETMALEALCH